MVYPIYTNRNPVHIIYHNQNRFLPGEENPLLSSAHIGKKWAEKNMKVGKETSNYLEISFLLDVLRNYFSSFLDPENNFFVRYVVKTLYSACGFLDGTRDKKMYEEIYAEGLDEATKGKITNSEIADQEYVARGSFRDDFLENKLLEVHHNEKVIPKFWEWSTFMARVKPLLFLFSGFLPDKWRMAVETVEETPSRALWRLRFNAGALHANFNTTVWDLFKLKILSFFSNTSREEFNTKVREVNSLARKYFERKPKPEDDKNHKVLDQAGLGLYFKMLLDRLDEHRKNLLSPQEALKRKEKDGFLKKTNKDERAKHSERTIDKGYVSLDKNGNPDSDHDIDFQRTSSITDFTGPLAGTWGLLGTFLFEPLKIVWEILGVQGGKNLISGLSATRKSASLLNYYFRFIKSEIDQGSQYTELEKLLNVGEKSNGVNKATKQIYQGLKMRYMNGLFGNLVVIGNMVEPVFHFFKSHFEHNRFANFLFGVLVKFNDNGLVRLFSKRREGLGRVESVNALVRDKILTTEVGSVSDYNSVSDEELEASYELPGQEGNLVESYLNKASKFYDIAKGTLTGETPEDILDLKVA